MRVCGQSAFQKQCNSVQIRRGLRRFHSKKRNALQHRCWVPVLGTREHAGSGPVQVPTLGKKLSKHALPCSFVQLRSISIPKSRASTSRNQSPFEACALLPRVAEFGSSLGYCMTGLGQAGFEGESRLATLSSPLPLRIHGQKAVVAVAGAVIELFRRLRPSTSQ